MQLESTQNSCGWPSMPLSGAHVVSGDFVTTKFKNPAAGMKCPARARGATPGRFGEFDRRNRTCPRAQ
jgi:hypothetical protein